MQKKMSQIIKAMAQSVLVDPHKVSSEAAHAALLLAHVAWNRANAAAIPEAQYEPLMRELECSRPAFWDELKSRQSPTLIRALVAYKNEHHPSDLRYIAVCGMRAGNVHVEWTDPAGDGPNGG
jgi:hypothetical protein